MSDAGTIIPYAGSSEPPFRLRAEGYDYEHEILVGLPPSYQVCPERSYPVLWVMDGALLFEMTLGILNLFAAGGRLPEIIVAAVGHAREEGLQGLRKRTADLFPPGSGLTDALGLEYMRGLGMDPEEEFKSLKGDRFLDFLTGRARAEVAARYRCSEDHALFGFSAGGAFTGYALFAKPSAYRRWIIGSGTNLLTLDLEAEYARSHEDLAAELFIGTGELEASNLAMSAQRIVSRTILLAENLRLRQYPSLNLTTRVYAGRDHFTVIPSVIGDGLQAIYAKEAAQLPTPGW